MLLNSLQRPSTWRLISVACISVSKYPKQASFSPSHRITPTRPHSRSVIAKSATELKKGEIDGATLIARALKSQGVEYVFGVAGIPIIEVAMAIQAAGIKYVGCRNEQSAAYAAQAMGYLTRKPVICLTVSGPGVLHTIGGLANSRINGWPFIVIGGASDADQDNSGAFQEYPTLDAVRPHVKHASRPSTLGTVPGHIETAIRAALYGRPGPAYVEVPGNLVLSTTNESKVPLPARVPSERPVSRPSAEALSGAAELLQGAKKPLVIFGKGAAWSERGPEELTKFVDATGLPFLANPGGKGVISDSHPLSIGPARSTALREADVVILAGTRLNWMLHFGQPPRFNKDVKFIHIDIEAERFHQNHPTTVPLLGDVGETVAELQRSLADWKFSTDSDWLQTLQAKAEKNRQTVEKLVNDETPPLNYYAAYKAIREYVTKNDVLVVNEGANTMDIGRTMMPTTAPRRRLDAGTMGTMGIGAGYTLAASLFCRDHSPATKVLCVIGDSAFGFSGMEVETIARYRLPAVIVVINNGGIYRGLTPEDWNNLKGDPTLEIPVLALTPECRYHDLGIALGGDGVVVRTVDGIRKALIDGFKSDRKVPLVINVIINNDSERKKQDHDWLTRSKN